MKNRYLFGVLLVSVGCSGGQAASSEDSAAEADQALQQSNQPPNGNAPTAAAHGAKVAVNKAPVAEAPAAEAPAAEAPTAEAPTAEARGKALIPEAPTVETFGGGTPGTEAPRVEAPTPAISVSEAPGTGVSESAAAAFASPNGEPLREFAAKCDLATGISVPSFQCSNGTAVPMTRLGVPITSVPADGLCDRPNRLGGECDPGSRGQIVAQSADAVAFAHCRRHGLTGNMYNDVAVIQYNRRNGAVCFYQIELGAHDGNIKAPSQGTSNVAAPQIEAGASDWRPVNQQRGCFSCHDNGALIRSPYITQLTFFPGRLDNDYNKVDPIRFVGNDFQDIVLSKVTVSGDPCTSNCHRLGMSNLGTGGTARDFGLRATQEATESGKMPHSATSPLWMTVGTTAYNAANYTFAQLVANCANNPAETANCSVTPFSTTWSGMSPGVLAALL